MEREAEAGVQWMWEGLVARRSITLLTSQWKSGKTTLASVLLARMKRGGELAGLEVAAGNAAVVTEEAAPHWQGRIKELDLGEHVYWLCRPFLGPPRADEWYELIETIELHGRRGLDLFVIDPLAAFFPAGTGNHAGTALTIIGWLQRLADLGIAVLILHHPTKGAALEGQAARGSGALAAAVDINIEMTGLAQSGRKRRLRLWSRYRQTPKELLIELNEAGNDFAAALPDAEDYTEQLNLLESVIESMKQKSTRKEILDSWPEDHPRPKLATIWKWLDVGIAEGRFERDGSGLKGEPYRYWNKGCERRWWEWWVDSYPGFQDESFEEIVGFPLETIRPKGKELEAIIERVMRS